MSHAFTEMKGGFAMFKGIPEARLKAAMTAYVEESLAEFREATGNADIPLHTYYLFINMPAKGHITVSTISKFLKGLTDSSITRNLQILAGLSKTRKDGGFKFLEYQEDPADRRYKLYSLNDKGREVRDRMHARGLRVVDRMLTKENDDAES